MGTFLRKGGGEVGDRLRTYGSTGKKKKQRVKKSYQRFFDGYVEVPVEKPGGKGVRIERIYVADYYAADLSAGGKVGVRLGLLALLACALASFASAALVEGHFNLVWYCVIFEALSVGSIVLGLITLVFRYIPYTGKMTRWQYRQAVVRLRWILKLAPLFVLASALMGAFSLLFHPAEGRAFLTALPRFLAAAALLYAAGLLEKRVPYKTVPSGRTAPIGSVDIATMKEVKPPKPKKEDHYGGADLEDLTFEADDEEDEDRRFF